MKKKELKKIHNLGNTEGNILRGKGGTANGNKI